MKKFVSYILFVALFFASCKTVQVAVPSTLRDNAEKYHVKGTSVSVFGHKIKIEGFGEAKMHSGFSVSSGTDKRWFPLYFDLDKRLNYVSNHFKNSISKSKTKYRFDFVSNDIYVNTYCVARSSESSVDIRDLDVQLSLRADYSFEGLIFTNKDTNPWKLSFKGSNGYQKGLGSYLNNIRQTDGVLTNDTDVIQVNLVNINTRKEDGTTRRIPFKIAAGYEFRLNDNLLAFVDVLDRNIWVSRSVDTYTRAVLVSAATSILVKANAS